MDSAEKVIITRIKGNKKETTEYDSDADAYSGYYQDMWRVGLPNKQGISINDITRETELYIFDTNNYMDANRFTGMPMFFYSGDKKIFGFLEKVMPYLAGCKYYPFKRFSEKYDYNHEEDERVKQLKKPLIKENYFNKIEISPKQLYRDGFIDIESDDFLWKLDPDMLSLSGEKVLPGKKKND